MNKETLFIIDKKEGLSAEFSKLVSMMEYVRATTLDEVKDLSVDELDFLYADDANSIGMLLAHMVSVERAYQIETFENRDFTDEDIEGLNPGLDLGDLAREVIKGNPIDYYLLLLKETRKETIERFQSLPETWLFEQEPFWWDLPANNYFKWFHVFEDELNHRGQIRLIKKMMRNSNNASHHLVE